MKPENKSFTERAICEIEGGAIRREPAFGAALIEYLLRVNRIGSWNGFVMIRHVDGAWHIAVGLLGIGEPAADAA